MDTLDIDNNFINPIKISKKPKNKNLSEISVSSYKNKYILNTDKKLLNYTNRNNIKEKNNKTNNEKTVSIEKTNGDFGYNNYNHIKNSINLLDLYKKNMIKKKKRNSMNEEQFDNSKNCSLSSSFSINIYNNNAERKYNNFYYLNKQNRNDNKIVKSISNTIKYQNNENNNYNKATTIINSYKYSKDKYSYILNKKNNRNKGKKINVSKAQSCSKIDSINLKNISNNKNASTNSIVKYEKDEDKNINNKNKSIENAINSTDKNSLILLNKAQNMEKEKFNLYHNNYKENLEKINKEKKLSIRQKAFYLLCTSPILRLNEQLILSRNYSVIRNDLPIVEILKNHEIFLEKKVIELNQEINFCSEKVTKPFTASKIADITLNFITKLDEQEFRDFDIISNNTNDINIFYSFIKILYFILDEQYEKNTDNKEIKKILFYKINEKGFKSLKDYLYFIYIRNKKKNNVARYIEDINEIISSKPEIMDKNYSFKMCRFMAFSIYLIREIINYANNIKDTIELKIRTKQFLDIVIEKLNKIRKKNNKMNK